MGNNILIVLSVVMGLFVILSIFTKATVKRRTESMEEKYNNIFKPLIESIREKDCFSDDSLVVKIITDTEDGVFALRDDEKKICAIAWKDGTVVFPFSDYKACNLDTDGKILLNLNVGDTIFPISVSTGRIKNNSFLGKELFSMATKLKNFLDEIIE